MVKWYDNLYVDKKVGKNIKKAQKHIKAEKILTKSYYVVALSSNGVDLFDIIHSKELLFAHYKRNVIYVVALGKTRESAVELVEKIILDQIEKGCESAFRACFGEELFQE